MPNRLVITTTYHKAKPDAKPDTKPDGICINALAGEAGAGQIFCATAS
jgi:hypothetical protein